MLTARIIICSYSLTLILPKEMSSAKYPVCVNFHSASKSFKICESMCLSVKQLGPG